MAHLFRQRTAGEPPRTVVAGVAGAPAVGVVLARALGFGREPVAARTAGTTGLAGDRDGAVVQGAYRSVVPVGDIRQWRSHRRDDATR